MVLLRPVDGNKQLIIVVGVWATETLLQLLPVVRGRSSPCQSFWCERSRPGTEVWGIEARTGFKGVKETWGFFEKKLSPLAREN